jgi:predicted RNA binding protein YcfA (HicA-like mRNA interferase family)
MVSLVTAFGFMLQRTRGSHHIYAHPDIPESRSAGEAKPYQIRQFLRLIEKYNRKMEDA